MAYEVKITKYHAGVLIDIEDREKVMIKFGKDGCSTSKAIARAIHESVKNVRLPKEVLDKMQKEFAFNREKRMACRELRKKGIRNVSGRKSPTRIEVPVK